MWAVAAAVLVQWQLLVTSWPCVVLPQGLCSAVLMVALYPGSSCIHQCSQSYTLQVILARILATALALAQPPQLLPEESLIILLLRL